MKTYHLLAGLPRSGNTLLSAILNQNPDIYSSPLSPITGMLWDFDQGHHGLALWHIAPVAFVIGEKRDEFL